MHHQRWPGVLMTVLELAAKAGNDELFDAMQVEFLQKFAELVRADEREACAKVCEEQQVGAPSYFEINEYIRDCAAAIRTKNQQ
jgi:hypothetical protein